MTWQEGYALYGTLALKIAKRLRPNIPRSVTNGELRQFALIGLWQALERGEYRDEETHRNYVAQRINGSVYDLSRRTTGFVDGREPFVSMSELGPRFDKAIEETLGIQDKFDWDLLDQRINKLESDQKKVMKRLRKGLSKAEVAAKLRVPWQTVQYQFEKARRALLATYDHNPLEF